MMFEDPDKGRASITESLELLRKVKDKIQRHLSYNYFLMQSPQNLPIFILMLFLTKKQESSAYYLNLIPQILVSIIKLKEQKSNIEKRTNVNVKSEFTYQTIFN